MVRLAAKLAQRAGDAQELIFQPKIACRVVLEPSVNSLDQGTNDSIVCVQRLKELDAGPQGGGIVGARRGLRRVTCSGNRVVQQGSFSTATIDADNALRTIAVSPVSGTVLWDAVDLSARALTGQGGGRVLVLLTDGNDVGSQASEAAALASLHKAGVIAYPIAFGTHADVAGLKALASGTGGSFHAGATSAELKAIYASIAAELQRTWRVEYLTTARPGDKLSLKVSAGRLGSDRATATVPGSYANGAGKTNPSPLLPSPLYGKLGDLIFTLLAGLLVLGAGLLIASTLRGSWLKQRLAPHIEPSRRTARRRTGRDRLRRGRRRARRGRRRHDRHRCRRYAAPATTGRHRAAATAPAAARGQS